MVNQPVFSNAEQFKANATVGFTHIEAQIAYSPVKHLGVTGGAFLGQSGQLALEGGLTGYSKLVKHKRLFVSAGLSLSKGTISNNHKPKNFDNVQRYAIDCNYEGIHFQYGIYLHGDDEHINREEKRRTYGLVIKHHYINYSGFSYIETPFNPSRLIRSTREISITNLNLKAFTMMCFYEKELSEYATLVFQTGLQPKSTPVNDLFDAPPHQRIFWLPSRPFFNISFGVKID